jgi:dephospho-CoA kinase
MMSKIRVLGITGGIATGKSTALMIFAELGAQVLSADDIARKVLALGEPAFYEVVARFGKEMLTSDGQLDRPAIAKKIFADPQARRDLDAITHPRIISKIDEEIKAFRSNPTAEGVLAVEIPLLIECSMEDMVDEVILIAAEQQTQVHRLTSRSGLSRDEALQAIAAQMSIDHKIQHADRVIWNDSDMEFLRSSIEKVWREILLLLKE